MKLIKNDKPEKNIFSESTVKQTILIKLMCGG